MLSKVECVEAAKNWELMRQDYSIIENLFPAYSCFKLTKQECDWINENNYCSNFHAYIGVFQNKTNLILVPLDDSGEERILSAYCNVPLSTLDRSIMLVEKETVTTTTKTTLSETGEVTASSQYVDTSTFNEPTLSERASLTDIVSWKNDSLNWFYQECKDHSGQRIFKTFTVPFSDLNPGDPDYDEVYVLFGLKNSSLYQREIPVLIFVAVNSQTLVAQIIRSSSSDNGLYTNTKDYSQPCPPMCRTEKKFTLTGDLTE